MCAAMQRSPGSSQPVTSDEHERPARRVVITGLGIVAPNGIGKDPFWQACLAGRSGLRHITRFDASPLTSQIAGEVTHFDPERYDLTRDEVTQLDRASQLALAAAHLAQSDAANGDPSNATSFSLSLTDEQRERSGVIIGQALSCLEAGERQWATLTMPEDAGNEPQDQQDYQSYTEIQERYLLPEAQLFSHAAASSIAAHYQFYGPCSTVATGCSAGADAIGQAFWQIQTGRADRMLAGGADSSISYGVMDAFCVMGALSSQYNAEPTRASRPYDGARDGFVMAEGAGVVLLEAREQALARGAHIYAEIIAFASNSNAHHMTALPPDGQPLRDLLCQVIAEAGLQPEAIDYINAHGSSTRPNEIAETMAYKTVFGEQAYHIPINATKSLIGHTQGAASAIETIVSALVLHEQMIPPTINQEQPDPICDLDYVPNSARAAHVQIALTHSSGFGGVNSALVLAQANREVNA
ncbi:beta-ketoacyl-[acyl-carrier-protein] synthase II [Ktedonobacteria bacterium brp13]|nr:beta-ketoacyl-[acyl-carrier-protein] synthase II [Ktedonobacteria bacterium brp13]